MKFGPFQLEALNPIYVLSGFLVALTIKNFVPTIFVSKMRDPHFLLTENLV